MAGKNHAIVMTKMNWLPDPEFWDKALGEINLKDDLGVSKALKAILAAACFVALSSTSCWAQSMTTPEDGEYIGYYWNPVDFSGTAPEDATHVELQAKVLTRYGAFWYTFTTADVEVYYFWGMPFHVWSNTAAIPSMAWEPFGYYNSIYGAEIRARFMKNKKELDVDDPVFLIGWSGGSS